MRNDRVTLEGPGVVIIMDVAAQTTIVIKRQDTGADDV